MSLIWQVQQRLWPFFKLKVSNIRQQCTLYQSLSIYCSKRNLQIIISQSITTHKSSFWIYQKTNVGWNYGLQLYFSTFLILHCVKLWFSLQNFMHDFTCFEFCFTQCCTATVSVLALIEFRLDYRLCISLLLWVFFSFFLGFNCVQSKEFLLGPYTY